MAVEALLHDERKDESPLSGGSWRQELTRYHWFVLTVAALGWLFDTMDQQLFNLARAPAMQELLTAPSGAQPARGVLEWYAGLATAVFLVGWASGGLVFGMLGDRIGRARTMVLTILIYSLCTGLSAFSRGFWDFAFYRFLTGLGVGGEFAVGVALVAEVMPHRARPFALGLLQALSAVGNIGAAVVSITLGHLEQSGVLGQFELFGITFTAWRMMFVVGTVPALLAIVIRRKLKEPEKWQKLKDAGKTPKLTTYLELVRNPRWRRNSLVGLALATSGVIGVWGIGFFSIDLNRSVLRKVFDQEARAAGEAEWDRDFLRTLIQDPTNVPLAAGKVRATDLLGPPTSPGEAAAAFEALDAMYDQKAVISPETVRAEIQRLDLPDAAGAGGESYLAGTPAENRSLDAYLAHIAQRNRDLNGRLTRWAGYTSVMLNVGAFLGIYAFSHITHYVGRRPAFAMSFVAAGLSTALVFSCLNDVTDVFWMIPLMGFCLLSLFGGYAIYFPELFPTHLRSTGTSVCYNVGRFVAALGPFTLGMLTSEVFGDYPEPMRYAGVVMCSVFVLGLLALPFGPETKGQPLPD